MTLRTIMYASLILMSMPAAQAMNNEQKPLSAADVLEICNQIEKMYECNHNATLSRLLVSSSDIITNPANRIFARCLLSQANRNYSALALLIQYSACLSLDTENTKILTIVGDILNHTETTIASTNIDRVTEGEKQKIADYAAVSYYLLHHLENYTKSKRKALDKLMQPFLPKPELPTPIEQLQQDQEKQKQEAALQRNDTNAQ